MSDRKVENFKEYCYILVDMLEPIVYIYMVFFFNKNPQNLVTLRHLLNKNPSYEPNWNIYIFGLK
jgi:hypothetical protein